MKNFFYFFPLFFLVACSTATDKCTNVNQARIHQSYSADYDQDSNKTTVSAQARFGGSSGTTLETDGKCSFSHNHYPLIKNSLLGTSYDGNGAGIQRDHTFTFTNNESQTFTNSASILDIAIASPPATVSRSQNLTISWTGGGVRTDETVYLYVTDNSRTVLESVSTVNATSLTLAASKLTTLTNGAGQIYLKRYYSTTGGIQAGEVGGFISATYQTSKSNITLTD